VEVLSFTYQAFSLLFRRCIPGSLQQR